MDVVSLCPMRVTSVLWQPQRGGFVLTVVAKATFRLQPLEAALAEEQEYPNDDDNYWNDDPQRSMHSPTDLVPFKARPEVMLVGHAFAPRNEPARSLTARLAVGDVDKAIDVTCDRVLGHDGQVREAARFTRMPLRWERAAGGPDTLNPVGLRADARPDAYGAIPLPNLAPAGQPIASRGDAWVPAGFGPIAPMWPSRWQKLGRHATRYQTDAWNDSPLPDDVDPSYFNAAPEDQRPAELRDGTRLVLENLHPDHPRLVTSLPLLHPVAFAELPGQAPQRIHMECDTLWIDTDRSIFTLTWRGPVPLVSATQTGRILIVQEEGQARLSWSDVQRIESGGAPPAPPPSPAAPPRIHADPGPRRIHTQPAPARGPATLTDVNFAAALPFLRSERASAEPPRSGPSSTGALPFAPSAPEPPSAPHPSAAHPSGVHPPPPHQPPAHPPPGPLPPPAPPPISAGPPLPPPAPPPVSAGPPSLPLGPPPAAGGQASPPVMAPSAAVLPVSPPVMAPSAVPPNVVPPVMAPPVSDSPWAAGARADAPAFTPSYDPGMARGASPAASPISPLTGASAPTASPPSPSMPSQATGATAVAVSGATVGGALAASNAAAAAIAPPAPAPSPAARPVRAFSGREMVDLLWFDPAVLPAVREHPRYREILAEVAPKPKKASFDDDPFEDAIAPEEPEDHRARREVFAVLARGDSTDAEGVGEAMADAVGEDGTFVPPLVLLAGELTFVFDEIAALKATVAATSPFASSDKRLKETLDTVAELLQTPWLQGSPGVAEGLVQRIKEAFAQGNRALPASYLDAHTERSLLEQRAFQKRTVFGEPHLRALLAPLGVQAAIPAYLPEPLATKLPMVLRMRVRLLAEASLPQDQYETYPASLRAVAIARVSPLPGRRVM